MTGRNPIMPKIIWMILGCVILRIFCSVLMGNQWALFAQPEVAAYLMKETKPPQPVIPAATTQPATTPPTEPVEITEPTTQPPEPLTMPVVPEQSYQFEETDVSFVEMNYSAKRSPDLEMLLTQSLDWDLTSEDPSVLVFHSHGTEAFLPGEGYTYEEEGGEYRTTDADCNMLSVGEELVRLLNEAGIHAVHDRTYYDYPDYLTSYDNARIGLEEQLKKYPTVKLVIDLHRDSAERSDGSQWATEAIVNGEKSAQIMLVMGTDSYYTHPNWEKNLSIALKLQAVMEKTHDGSTRPLDLRKQRFNQDLAAGAIIAEVGAAGNTHREALNGVSVLAEAIILLAKGAN
jgi:stage II sporulation protein P